MNILRPAIDARRVNQLPTLRRMLLFGVFALAMLAFSPSRADAQCYFEVSSYADGWYSAEESALYYYGSGLDTSPCSCYHQWGIELFVTRVEDQVVTSSISDSDGNPISGSSSETTPGHYNIDVNFWVGCYCSGQSTMAAAQKVVTVEAPPACIPQLWNKGASGPFYQTYDIDMSPPFPALGNAIYYAADRWNNFIWGFTSLKAFQLYPSPTVWLRIEGALAGGPDWAVTRVPDPYYGPTSNFPIFIDVNPWLFGDPALYDAVLLHEFGHARGYSHVGPGCANESILNIPFNPEQPPYATGFGPSDTVAAQRDIH